MYTILVSKNVFSISFEEKSYCLPRLATRWLVHVDGWVKVGKMLVNGWAKVGKTLVWLVQRWANVSGVTSKWLVG